MGVAGTLSLLTGLTTGPAWASLEICNGSSVHRSVAIGYSKDDVWTSEGWWNLDPGQCATPVEGALEQRYYYYRAEAEDGSFPGDGYTFCTTTGSFTIVGDEDCESRGYVVEDFREIDTGAVATTFTHIISEAEMSAAAGSNSSGSDAVTGPADSDLRICNRTDVKRHVAIGYSKDDQWVSEGWWNLEPGQCATPVEGALEQRYYYYRAEDPDEQFDGGYTFCTVDDAFTIIGDEDCEARGYETHDFREIDTGPEAPGYVFVLDADTVSEAREDATGASQGSDVVTGPADSGLRICNNSTQNRFVAIGYPKDDDWVSEGWWTLDQGECATPVEGDLTQRFYYYRAEDPDEQYQGQGYTFCTVDDAFTIVGDTECEARGYETHDFSQIDTGLEAQGYVFVIQPGDGDDNVSNVPTGGGGGTGKFDVTRGADVQPVVPAPSPDGAKVLSSAPSGDGAPPGTQGGPVDVMGVFLGCDVSDSDTLCAFHGEDGPYTVVGAESERDAFEAMLELALFQKARVQGGILAQGDTTTEIFATAIVSQDVGDDPLDSTRNGLQGGWQSLDDQQAFIRFDDGRYFDYHEGDLTAGGGYAVATTCPGKPASGGEEPVIIVRLAGESTPSCYSLMYMDGRSLEMLAPPHGALLRYARQD